MYGPAEAGPREHPGLSVNYQVAVAPQVAGFTYATKSLHLAVFAEASRM